MLSNVLSSIVAAFIFTEIEVTNLRTDLDACEMECGMKNGHLPYLFEGTSVFVITFGSYVMSHNLCSISLTHKLSTSNFVLI